MKKRILRGIAVAAMTGLTLTVRAQDSTSDQSQYPTILEQPVDQCLPIGAAVTFSVTASNVDSYQWYKNNVAVDGETNSTLTISAAGINDVGYYGASAIKGLEAVPTRLACLNVYTASSTSSSTTSGSTPPRNRQSTQSMTMMSATDIGGGGVITVYGAPVTSSGSTGTCPGAYSGYVNYIKPISQGWGFYTDTNTTVHTATDLNRTDTKMQYLGYSMDSNCGQTSITIPNPSPSIKYRFTIFFPRGSQIPTNAYPITLEGFNP